MRGDDLSLEIVFETAGYLAIGSSNLARLTRPRHFRRGHDLRRSQTELGAASWHGSGKRSDGSAARIGENTAIDFASLGSDAGYIGAAGVARLDYLKQAQHAA